MENVLKRCQLCWKPCLCGNDVANLKLESIWLRSRLLSRICVLRYRSLGPPPWFIRKQRTRCWPMVVLLQRNSKKCQYELDDAIPICPSRIPAPFWIRRSLCRRLWLRTIWPHLYFVHLGCDLRRKLILDRISVPLRKRWIHGRVLMGWNVDHS